jgi:CRP-like cAMP-binding protein
MPGTGLFVIEEGEVVVDLTSRRVELGPGEFVGELALLTDSAHTGRAIARTRVKAVALDRDEFSELLHSEPSMALAMLSTLARRLAAAP